MKKTFFFLLALILGVIGCSDRSEETKIPTFDSKNFKYSLSEIKSKKKTFPTQHVIQITGAENLPLNTEISFEKLDNLAIDPEHLKVLKEIDIEYIKILEVRSNHIQFDDSTIPATRFEDFYNYARFNAWLKEYIECNQPNCATRYETKKKRSINRMWDTYFTK